jgi:hypothetical protein
VKEPKTLLVESRTDMWKCKALSPDGKYRHAEQQNKELLVKVQTSYNTDAHSS